jgi:hypothetical protein
MSKPKSDAETLEEGSPVLGLIPIAQGFPDTAPTRTTTFSDTLYTSRTLILPDDRTLAVVKGAVSVNTSDDLALNYLKTHAEFELLKE